MKIWDRAGGESRRWTAAVGVFMSVIGTTPHGGAAGAQLGGDPVPGPSPGLVVSLVDRGYALSLDPLLGGPQGAFYVTSRPVENARAIVIPAVALPTPEEPDPPVPTHPTVLALWNERQGDGELRAYRAIRLGGAAGADMWHNGDANLDGVFDAGLVCIGEIDYRIMLRYAQFDPVGLPGQQGRPGIGEPHPPAGLRAEDVPGQDGADGGGCHVYIVQFWTQMIEEFRRDLTAAGARIDRYLPHNGCIITVPTATQVTALRARPYVRWIGPLHPAFRLQADLLRAAIEPQPPVPPHFTCTLQLLQAGAHDKLEVAEYVESIGGTIDELDPDGYTFRATLSGPSLALVARLNDLVWMDPWSAPTPGMDLVRTISGANYLESNPLAGLNFKGQGVRGQVREQSMLPTHTDFQHFGNPPAGPLVRPNTDFLPGAKHGTSTFGIIFGNGSTNGQARGMLPEAEQGIFSGGLISPVPIYTDIAQQVDPMGPYRSVFHSESYGALGPSYNSTSFTYDDLVYRYDMLMTILMHNSGLTGDGNDQVSFSAWAKNVVSVGGIYHFNTLSRADDRWCTCTPSPCLSCASIGPAEDGRVKPDLVHFYDNVFTTTSFCAQPPGACQQMTCDPQQFGFPNCQFAQFTEGHEDFGGTSAATPIVAGCFGLFFQMWHKQVFPGFGGGTSVFDDKAHAATAKAMLINTAYQYALPSSVDITRFTQGWGMPDLQRMHELRMKMFIVNESDIFTVLDIGQAKTYYVTVAQNEPELKVTLVYTDVPGTTNATLHRVNDLSLRVVAPGVGGAEYWGNHNLASSNWSTPGGTPDKFNTVENVFVPSPIAGCWRIDVIAFELNQDGRIETPSLPDWDFALVASGVAGACLLGCDWNGDGVVDSRDVFGFIDAFLRGEADVDGDGASTAKDMGDFLVRFLGAPR